MRIKKTNLTLFIGLISLVWANFSAAKGEVLTTEIPETIVQQHVEHPRHLSYCPLPSQTPDKISIDTKTDVPFVDLNRGIKDLGTKFVVNEFFKTPDTLFNFLKLVYETVNESVTTYRNSIGLDENALLFIFKGGNVLRMVANGVFEMLHPDARNYLKQEFSEFFKRSDADFSILLDSSKLKDRDYDYTYNKLTEITYQALNKVRNEFKERPEKYFNFFQLKSSVASDITKKYLEEVKNLEAVSDPENPLWYNTRFLQFQLLDQKSSDLACQYQGQHDYRFETSDYDDKLLGVKLTQKPDWINNTINLTLEWPREAKKTDIVRFNLVRLKVQPEYTFIDQYGRVIRKPVGGELVDVSIPHRDDFRFKNFFRRIGTEIGKYSLTSDAGEKMTMSAESVDGLASDLFEILFEQFPRPWEGTKYEKRINRLFFIYIMDMLGNETMDQESRKVFVKTIREKIVEQLETVQVSTDAEALAKLNAARDEIKTLAEAQGYKTMPRVHRFLGAVVDTLENMRKDPHDGDQEGIKSFFEKVRHNLDVMDKVIELQPFSIDIEKVYDVQMRSLI